MNITKLLNEKQKSLSGAKPITIAFLGDSVTQGCFECYTTSNTSFDTVFDNKSAYSTRVREILNTLYPTVQVNIINSGISGDSAPNGLKRLERDVLSYNPDLVVVSYGLNDSVSGIENIENYASAIKGIFAELKNRGIETIFLTQNYMNTTISPHLKDEVLINLANKLKDKVQNNNTLKEYFAKAKELAKEYGVTVCDLYSVWEKMAQAGVNVTELLANKLNHPIREYHYYIAIKLIECMLGA